MHAHRDGGYHDDADSGDDVSATYCGSGHDDECDEAKCDGNVVDCVYAPMMMSVCIRMFAT